MARSIFKLPFIHRSLWEKSIKTRKHIQYSEELKTSVIPEGVSIQNNFYFWKRSSVLNKRLAETGRAICIYNGYAFIVLYLKNQFFGYKLGQFAVSRRTPRHKGKQRQKKKKV